MVLRGAQIQPCGQARCGLFSAQSLLHDFDWLYGRALRLTSPDLAGVADSYIDELGTWADSHVSWPEIVGCDSEEHHEVKNLEKSSDEHDHLKAA